MPATAWGEYRVGPGDVLELAVAREEKLSGKHTVDEDGAIELDLLGEIVVAGKSPEEIDDLLTAKLKAFFKAPSVRVSVAEYHSQKVYVLGAVSKQGSYVIDGELTLLDAILEAGGTTSAALGKVQLLRADTRVASVDAPHEQSIDLDKLLSGGPQGPANLKLANGDMVVVQGSEALGSGGGAGVVDASTKSVTVVGEVSHPGVFRLESGATALAAVLAAGGLTKYAAPGRAKVVRSTKLGRKVIALELDDVMKRGEKSKDVVLEPGDMVIVPARLF